MTIKLKAVEVEGWSCYDFESKKHCFYFHFNPCSMINCSAKGRKDGKNIIWVEDK